MVRVKKTIKKKEEKIEKQFLVIDETDTTYVFGTDAGIKLGVVRKEDCVEV